MDHEKAAEAEERAEQLPDAVLDAYTALREQIDLGTYRELPDTVGTGVDVFLDCIEEYVDGRDHEKLEARPTLAPAE